MEIKFKKGGNEGSVSHFPQQDSPYLALTVVESKWFKTEKGAVRWMEKRGYKAI